MLTPMRVYTQLTPTPHIPHHTHTASCTQVTHLSFAHMGRGWLRALPRVQAVRPPVSSLTLALAGGALLAQLQQE